MRILVVEDEEKLAKLIKKILKREGYAIDYMTDGQSALKRIEVSHVDYDVIILDLELPGKGGLEICESVRSYKIDTPILVLTGKADVKSKKALFEAGADDYLVKPFEFDELIARIRAITRRPKKVMAKELVVSDVTLNPMTKKVFRNGQEIKMTLKEFGILEYLMQNPDQALKREDIITKIWDFDYDAFSNILDVFINKIRKKIDQGRSRPLIETVRGIGYRINSQA